MTLGSTQKRIRIAAFLEVPFVMQRSVEDQKKGDVSGATYIGYHVDLLDSLALAIGFTYELYIIPDDFHSMEHTMRTTLLLTELSSGNASLAILPVGVTSSRDEAVDLSKAFDTVITLSAVLKQSNSYDEKGIFQFIKPLTPTVWILLSGVFVTVTAVHYAIDRLKYGGNYRHEAEEISKGRNGTGLPLEDVPLDIPVRRRMTAFDCVWYTFSSMVLMPHQILGGAGGLGMENSTPRCAAIQLLNGSLWWFSLVIVASYASNMAALMTIAKFKDGELQRLVNSDVTFRRRTTRILTLNGSDVSAFLDEIGRLRPGVGSESENAELRRMWHLSHEAAKGLTTVNSIAEGLHYARLSKDYAFVHHTLPLRQTLSADDCDLDEFTYRLHGLHGGNAFGVPKGAGYLEQINTAITRMSRDGTWNTLKTKWLPVSRCTDRETSDTSPPAGGLTTQDLGGLFLILVVCVVLSVILSAFEYCYQSSSRQKYRKNSAKRSENHMCVALPGRNQRRQRSLMDSDPSCTATTAAVDASADSEAAIADTTALSASLSSVDALHEERCHVMTFVEPVSSSNLSVRNSTSHARETNF